LSDRLYRVWIDADGTTWFEDPDPTIATLAQTLGAPEVTAEAVLPLAPPRLLHTIRIPAPTPWPSQITQMWEWHHQLLHAGTPVDATNGFSLLDLKLALASGSLQACNLCEHRCGVDRTQDERGRCGVGKSSRFAAAFVHVGEEAVIAPSFSLALTGCSWHCSYCHTYDWVTNVEQGRTLNSNEHAPLLKELLQGNARTLSFVGGNPDHHVAAILAFLEEAVRTAPLPVVWNTNMYGSPELFALLDGVVDIYLGDFRYGSDTCAYHLSGIEHAWNTVTRNWLLAAKQDALCIVRVLVLPGHLHCCIYPIFEWLSTYLPQVGISLLDQYHPTYRVGRFTPEIDRLPSEVELNQARAWLASFGLKDVSAAGIGVA